MKARPLDPDKRGTIPDMIRIPQRPEEIQDRAVPGWLFHTKLEKQTG